MNANDLINSPYVYKASALRKWRNVKRISDSTRLIYGMLSSQEELMGQNSNHITWKYIFIMTTGLLYR